MTEKSVYVAFANSSLEKDFESLENGRFEDKQLYDFIQRSINDLKKNPTCGVKIPKRLWPKRYVRLYKIANLWKYDLPNGWRLIYSILQDEVMIINLILEWFSHKDYEKKFSY